MIARRRATLPLSGRSLRAPAHQCQCWPKRECFQDDEAIYSVDPVELLSGELPRRQRRLVEAWAELHQTELLADWQQLQAGQVPQPIDPLKK